MRWRSKQNVTTNVISSHPTPPLTFPAEVSGWSGGESGAAGPQHRPASHPASGPADPESRGRVIQPGDVRANQTTEGGGLHGGANQRRPVSMETLMGEEGVEEMLGLN